MQWNRFDICEAYYLWLSENHEGMWSEKYKRLCKLLEYFLPNRYLNYEGLTENGKEIYDRIGQ